MRDARLTRVMVAAVLMGACGGGEGGASREAGPWRLEASLSSAGAGIPFCEGVTARVSEFMSQFDGQMPPSTRYGGTAVVGNIGDMPGGMNGLISTDVTAAQHQFFVNLMTLVQYDENLNPMPYLAESWEVSNDETEITFHIRAFPSSVSVSSLPHLHGGPWYRTAVPICSTLGGYPHSRAWRSCSQWSRSTWSAMG